MNRREFIRGLAAGGVATGLAFSGIDFREKTPNNPLAGFDIGVKCVAAATTPSDPNAPFSGIPYTMVASSTATASEKAYALASGGGVCDGVADQEEINKAINSLPSGGGAVSLSSGVFHISSPVTLNERPAGNRYGITMTGAGYSSILKLDNNANCNVLEFEAVWPMWNRFACFNINGNKENNPGGGYGIALKGWQSIFEDLIITNCKSGGIHSMDNGNGEGNRYKGLWIYNCDNYGYICDQAVTDEVFDDVYVSTTGVGFMLNGGYHRMYACETDNCMDISLRMTAGDSIVTGCRFGGSKGIEISGGFHNIVSSTRIVLDSAESAGIYINPGRGKWCDKHRFSDIYVEHGASAFEVNGDTDKMSLAATGVTLNAVGAKYGKNLTAAMVSNPGNYSILQLL